MKFCLPPPPPTSTKKTCNFNRCWFVETNTNLTKVILNKSKKFKIQIENNKYLVNLTCTLDFNWLWLELHKRKALIACTVCRIVGLKASCIYIYKVNILNSSQIVVLHRWNWVVPRKWPGRSTCTEATSQSVTLTTIISTWLPW